MPIDNSVMINVPFDTVILAAVISAIVAISINAYREHGIEPRRFRKNAKLQALEERLQAYGSLLNVIEVAEQRAKVIAHPEVTHSLSKPDGTTEFMNLFERNYHLFSNDLNKEYLKLVHDDKYFGLTDKPKGSQELFGVKLYPLQRLAEEQYSQLKEEYKKITGYGFNSFYKPV